MNILTKNVPKQRKSFVFRDIIDKNFGVKKGGFVMGLLRITELSKVLNIHPNTLRNWEKQGKITPERTSGGHRRYDLKKVEAILKVKYKTIVLIGNKGDLLKQKYERCILEEYCKKHNYTGSTFLELTDNDKSFLNVISTIEKGNVKFIIMDEDLKMSRKQQIILQSTCDSHWVEIKTVNLQACEEELFPN